MAEQFQAVEPLDLEIVCEAAARDRHDALVTAVLDPEDALFARTAGELATVVTLTEVEGPDSSRRVPGQLAENGRLSWLMTGLTPAGTQRRYRCTIERVRGGRNVGEPGNVVAVRLAGDHLWFTRDGVLLARYVYLANWKPYFWPILVSAGNVVRGASHEHQHQTGLFLAYGGHGGDGTTNVWSDWDEPPYGPCGKMVHHVFDLVEGGPVYGRFVQRVTYTRADGPTLFAEIRDVRVTPLTNGDLIFDVERHAEQPDERGPKPFILGARVADSMRLVDLTHKDPGGNARPLDRPGVLMGAAELALQRSTNATYRTSGPWLDWSGAVGDGVAGIAFFDHPANPEYGVGVTAGGYGCMTMSHHYPDDAAAATFRYRAIAHTGDAATARIAERFQDYVDPVRVALTVLQRPSSPVSAHERGRRGASI